MPCYHPLLAWPVGTHPSGKPKYKITGYNDWEYYRDPDHALVYRSQAIEIPCGQCIGCRLQYSREWANRCMLELQQHHYSVFVTLTYDNDHIDHLKRGYVNESTGEYGESLSLCKRDFQLFMKRLRKRFSDQRIRFFAAGEYGDQTFRPHYHAILFGLHLDDLKFYKTSDINYNYYTSAELSKCWPFGFAVVGDVSWETCAYTARYICKKLKGDEAKFYQDFDLEPPFSLMSRKPGLGRDSYDPDRVANNSEFIIATDKKLVKFLPPKYFKRIFELDFPEESAIIKAGIREQARARKELKLSQTDLTYLDMLSVDEDAQLRRLHGLHRDLD